MPQAAAPKEQQAEAAGRQETRCGITDLQVPAPRCQVQRRRACQALLPAPPSLPLLLLLLLLLRRRRLIWLLHRCRLRLCRALRAALGPHRAPQRGRKHAACCAGAAQGRVRHVPRQQQLLNYGCVAALRSQQRRREALQAQTASARCRRSLPAPLLYAPAPARACACMQLGTATQRSTAPRAQQARGALAPTSGPAAAWTWAPAMISFPATPACPLQAA